MATPDPLQAQLTEAIRAEAKGQPFLWSGRPSARAAFRKDMPLFVMGIIWIVIMLLIPGGHLFEGLPNATWSDWPFIAYFGGVFVLLPVLVGVFIMVQAYWPARRAGRSIYAITRTRQITVVLGRKKWVRSVYLGQVRHMRCNEWRNGVGEIELILDYDDESQNVSLYAIPDVRKVYDLLVSLKVHH